MQCARAQLLVERKGKGVGWAPIAIAVVQFMFVDLGSIAIARWLAILISPSELREGIEINFHLDFRLGARTLLLPTRRR